MQRAEAGIPNATARVIRVAVDGMREGNMKEKSRSSKLTDVTPYRCLVNSVPGPHNGVHKLVKTGQRGPHHVVACPRVPRLQMPR